MKGNLKDLWSSLGLKNLFLVVPLIETNMFVLIFKKVKVN